MRTHKESALALFISLFFLCFTIQDEFIQSWIAWHGITIRKPRHIFSCCNIKLSILLPQSKEQIWIFMLSRLINIVHWQEFPYSTLQQSRRSSSRGAVMVIFIYSYMYMNIFIYFYTIHVFIYSYIHIFIYSYIHIFIYSYIHIFIYSYIHIYIPI